MSGNVAAISWRLAFWVLVIPSAALAWAIWRLLPEPVRGGATRLVPGETEIRGYEGAPAGGLTGEDTVKTSRESTPELERALRQAGVRPRPKNLAGPDAAKMKLLAAVRYVLSVSTNVALIIVSALGYFFISGT